MITGTSVWMIGEGEVYLPGHIVLSEWHYQTVSVFWTMKVNNAPEN